MKKTLLPLALAILCLCIGTISRAQKTDDDKPETALPKPIISPSPEAASLGKYGDVPIGLFKGMANVDIPFYTLAKGDISVPISINYSSSGIKVDEISTNVGLGWTLMAGGVITSSVSDKNDFNSSYSRVLPINPKNFHPNTTNTNDPDYVFARSYVNSHTAYDLQPDILNYNFCGRSGKFYFDTDLQVGHTIPASTVKISRNASGFTITDEKGINYLFTTTETSLVEDSCTVGASPRQDTSPGQTSYYLTQIVDTKGNVVNLTYENTSYYYSEGIEEAQYFSQLTGDCPLLTDHNSTCVKVQTVGGKRIKTISAGDNSITVTFNYSATARQDVVPLVGSEKVVSSLDGVVVTAGTATIKTITLDHDYFKTSGYASAPNSRQRALECRLKLLSVTESGKKPYVFTYNETQNLPSRLSYTADYWGYYKGNAGSSSVPADPTIGIPGGNREPDPSALYTQANLLTKVRYPTGGSTTIKYEPNDTYKWETVTEKVQHTIGCSANAKSSNTCTYTLSNSLQGASVTYHLQITGQHDNGSGTIDGPNSLHLEFAGNGTLGNQSFPAGSYTFSLENTYTSGITHLGIIWDQFDSHLVQNHYVMGGVRVAQTIDSTGIGIPVKKYYSYLISDTSKETSLFYKRISPSNYNYPYTTYHPDRDGVVSSCQYNVLRSAPIPLIGKGDPFNYGYTKVTVLSDSLGTQGKSVHYYSSSLQDFLSGTSQITDQSWLQGMELKQEDYLYNRQLQKYIINKRVANTYKVNLNSTYLGDNTNPALPPNQYSVYGMKLTQESPEFTHLNQVTAGTFKYEVYPVITAWMYQSRSDATLFNPSDTTRFLTTTTNTYFENPIHQQPTRTVTNQSDTTQITAITTYANDYASGTTFIDDMKTNHIISTPIEQVVYKSNKYGTNVASGSVTTYKPGGKDLIDFVYNFESTGVVPLSTFKFSNKTVGQLPYGTPLGGYGLDSRYQPKLAYNAYDNLGNLLTATPTNGRPESYLWDYQKLYPIAKVINADSLNIAYTSFEADGSGHWTIGSPTRNTSVAKTGNISYVLSAGNITKSGLTSTRSYVVSYWLNNTTPLSITGTQAGYPLKGATINGWTYFEHVVSGISTVTITGSSVIDELRLYPLGAKMATYTYTPYVGLTSTTDAKGVTTYFEYDNFQRLQNIKDKDQNIVKHVDYHYQGQ